MELLFSQEELYWLDDILPGTKLTRTRHASVTRQVRKTKQNNKEKVNFPFLILTHFIRSSSSVPWTLKWNLPERKSSNFQNRIFLISSRSVKPFLFSLACEMLSSLMHDLLIFFDISITKKEPSEMIILGKSWLVASENILLRWKFSLLHFCFYRRKLNI